MTRHGCPVVTDPFFPYPPLFKPPLYVGITSYPIQMGAQTSAYTNLGAQASAHMSLEAQTSALKSVGAQKAHIK